MRAGADRRSVGEPQRLDADQRRAGLQSQLARQVPARALFRRVDQRPRGSRPPAPTISEKRVRGRIG